MGSFQTPAGKPLVEIGSGEGIIWLNTGSGSKVTLKFAQGRGTGGIDGRKVEPDDPVKIKVGDLVRGQSAMAFSLTAFAHGVFRVKGFNAAGAPAGGLVVVGGSFNNHTDMDVDLLARICRGGDADKIAEVQRLLFNDPTNLFDQHSPANTANHGAACGKVCKAGAESLFSGISPISYENPYHEPLKVVRKREDVKYRSSVIESVRAAIAGPLKKGIPVRVGALHVPVGMFLTGGKLYAYYAGGHTVLIVGCNTAASKFLYIDPWAGGSKLTYAGGLADAGLGECKYMGIFQAIYDRSRAVEMPRTTPNLIRQTSDTEGSFSTGGGNFLEVVSGPPLVRAP
jgi:hypothetical protein